ncbi:2-dehydropantoate 2-reductase [Oceanivirga miroungae]|uniref:2-dehydropantoate 2-reductase n=1 Tax=Oceanivirga miroungae TaxID=1130046 RepID=A0A6I8MBN0_9FUSO|nr:2-dehydropantoate 2-reductase [Oceanivirga miroungae]VWL84827.1 2-dehydropantoate 2-reductase [Oceanivirga miroungae]
MKIVIAGSGAMGATYGSMLAKAGNQVVFLDSWQDNIDSINQYGCKFNNLGTDEVIPIQACKPSEFTDIPDLVIVFTKSMQLSNMLESVKHLFGANTRVLCLLNGLGHTDTLKRFVDPKNILMGVTVLTASMQGAGSFKVSNYGKTEIQNIVDDKEAIEGAKKVVETINNSGLPTVYSEDIMYSIWRKACINGTMNACCTILQCNMEQLGTIPNLRHLLGQIVTEFAMVAKEQGTTLDVKEMTDLVCWFTTSEFQGVKHYPSMYQDLINNHRKTEIDFLNGYVAKKAKEAGKEAFYCELITEFVHGKEKILGV